MIEQVDGKYTLLPFKSGERGAFHCLYLLKDISWSDTGLSRRREGMPPDWDCPILLTIIDGVIDGKFTAANYVLYRQWQRQNYLLAQEEFSELYRSKITELAPAEAKQQATLCYVEKVIQSVPTWSHSRASQVAHQILRIGSRWAALIHTCESVEVILLMQESLWSPESNKSIGDIINYGTNEEFRQLRRAFLDPSMRFLQDILRMTGLENMINELGHSDSQSELRAFLSKEIHQRLQPWPDTDEAPKCPPVLEADKHFDNSFDSEVNHVFGIHFKAVAEESEEGQMLWAQAAADYPSTTQVLSPEDILMVDEDYETLFNSI